MPRSPWKTPRTPSSCSRANRQIAEQAAEGVRLIGESPAIEALRSIIRRVADTDLAVLILGENGTGKEVVAQSIHYLSRRRDQPFIAVNCAAIPETLARKRAVRPRERGLHRRPREPPGQVRAGRRRHAVSRRDRRPEPERPGQAAARAGGKGRGPRGRIDADSHRRPGDGRHESESGRDGPRRSGFAQDLYFRLNVVTLDLPPLRERGERRAAAGRAFPGRLLPQGPSQDARVLRRGPETAGWTTPGRATSASCAT